MTVEDMKQGISKIRNHVIARVFRELNLIEQWGSGMPRIFREARELGLPELEIIEIGTRVRVVVHLAEQVTVGKTVSQGGAPTQSPTQPGGESGVDSGVELGIESEMAESVLEMLFHQEPLSKKEIAIKLGKAKPTRYLNELMAYLLNKGFVAYTIPEKPNSRLQKYRLMDKGRRLLSE
jgi:ATP-dependent DNA helicase RecG